MSQPAHARDRGRRSSRLPISRLAVAAALVLGLGYLNLTVTAGAILNGGSNLAQRLAPAHPRVQAASAERALHGVMNDRSQAEVAIAHGRAIAERDPTNPAGWRLLALRYDLAGDTNHAEPLYLFTERVSHRDLLTQLWLIENAVRHNDIDEALRHYDIGLRGSSASPALLMPVLARAATDEAVAPRLAAILARHPPWLTAFFTAWNAQQPTGTAALRLLVPLRQHDPLQSQEMQLDALVSGLVNRSDFLPALRIETMRGLIADPSAPLRNGDFARQPAASPFDWHFPATQGLEGRIDNQGGQAGNRLIVDLGAEAFGTGAQQILILRPGSYRLRVTGIALEGQPRGAINITCAIGDAGAVAALELAGRNGPNPAPTVDFTVPAGCTAQRLVVHVDASGSGSGSSLSLAGIRIDPA